MVAGSHEEASIPTGSRRPGAGGVVGARLCGALGAVNTGGERSEKGQEGPQVLAMLRMADMYGRMGGSEMEEHQRKPQRGHKLLDGSAGAWSTLVPVLALTSSAHKPRALLESPPAVPAQGPLPPSRTSLSSPPSRTTSLPRTHSSTVPHRDLLHVHCQCTRLFFWRGQPLPAV